MEDRGGDGQGKGKDRDGEDQGENALSRLGLSGTYILQSHIFKEAFIRVWVIALGSFMDLVAV